MGFLYWLVIGLGAGSIAKALTPQDEKGGWISSLIVGVIGAYVGGFLAGITGIRYILGSGLIGSLIVATAGAFLVLYIYHKYLKDKINVNL